MIEGLIIVIGLCITFLPIIIFVNYLFKHVKKETRFDYHKKIVQENCGTRGVVTSYLERILFGTWIMAFGITMSEFFQKEIFTNIFIISLILYIIVKYFDEKNAKF